jgi:signal transduction histidine kinase
VLADNTEGNLSQKQIKFAETIHSSGTGLLTLINDILDLSKIESGKIDVEVGNVRFTELEDYCMRTFRYVAEGKGIGLAIACDPELSSEILRTDVKRLQQVLKNLLSNALKFTARRGEAGNGAGSGRMEPQPSGVESRQERDRVLRD